MEMGMTRSSTRRLSRRRRSSVCSGVSSGCMRFTLLHSRRKRHCCRCSVPPAPGKTDAYESTCAECAARVQGRMRSLIKQGKTADAVHPRDFCNRGASGTQPHQYRACPSWPPLLVQHKLDTHSGRHDTARPLRSHCWCKQVK